MNARVAGERCALRRVTKANVSVIGGSKPTWWRRRPNGRPSATRRVPIVSPRPRSARASAASTYSTSICGSIVTPPPRARPASRRRGGGGGGELGKLAASRVVGAEPRVVEDQRRVGEPLDRHRLLHALGVLGEVEELV